MYPHLTLNYQGRWWRGRERAPLSIFFFKLHRPASRLILLLNSQIKRFAAPLSRADKKKRKGGKEKGKKILPHVTSPTIETLLLVSLAFSQNNNRADANGQKWREEKKVFSRFLLSFFARSSFLFRVYIKQSDRPFPPFRRITILWYTGDTAQRRNSFFEEADSFSLFSFLFFFLKGGTFPGRNPKLTTGRSYSTDKLNSSTTRWWSPPPGISFPP